MSSRRGTISAESNGTKKEGKRTANAVSMLFVSFILLSTAFFGAISYDEASPGYDDDDIALSLPPGTPEFVKNFGGPADDIFQNIAATPDGGFVAVGYSMPPSFGDGDWTGVTGKGNDDAIIVKYDEFGNIEWRKNFGGPANDYFNSVKVTPDGGFVAAGFSLPASFGDGDWANAAGKGDWDAIIVRFDASGNVQWSKNFGGSGIDHFDDVTVTPDGFVAVGYSEAASFSNGDWTGVTGKGGNDAIVVKFDVSGNVVWKKNFGGGAGDQFYNVTATPDGGTVAVGFSSSLTTGDWSGSGITGRSQDAIAVKHDGNGNVVWKKNFGGSGNDTFTGVAAALDGGFVAAGTSMASSFGNGDWSGVTGNGGTDAIIVKFNALGNVVWKKNFGGSGSDNFVRVATAHDSGFVAAGYSLSGSFGNGDWSGVIGNGGGSDATIVKFDVSGNVQWNKNFGGSEDEYFRSVATTSDGGFVTAGFADPGSFGSGGLTDVTGKGDTDAIVVKFHHGHRILSYDASYAMNFGGSEWDCFNSVIGTDDGGFVAVGVSEAALGGDWLDTEIKGISDAIIVRYDNNGNVVWKKNFGGYGTNRFFGVTGTDDGGFVAVGESWAMSFGNGDWTGVTGRGDGDAIIVKFDASGDVVWKKNFGGSGTDGFGSVTGTDDGGFVAAGYSQSASFGNGDWTGVTGRGDGDAIIVKFDASGDVVWKKNFGGSGTDGFSSVTGTDDGGFVAAGYSQSASFGNGDWTGVTGKGNNDAIIVKYDALGNVVWKKNFGGSGVDCFISVAGTDDGGFVAVGYSTTFNSGDWAGVTGKGGWDAIIVRFHAICPATINASDRTVAYDGTPQYVGAVLTDGEGNTIITDVSDLIITYEGMNGTVYARSATAPVNAGTYKVTIELNLAGYHAAPVTVILTINKADPAFEQSETYEYMFGQTLSAKNSLLLNEKASVPGTFAFKYPLYEPDVGVFVIKVTFTPFDTDNYNIAYLDLTIECVECEDEKCVHCSGCLGSLVNDCDGCEICTPCWCCDCKGKVNGCDCRYGMVCSACIQNECGNGNGCGCVPPVEISETEYLAGGGNRSRIITSNTGDHPSADDMWLIVIYETPSTNFSFLVKADEQMELFYQTNITAITVRLADGIPKILGGEGHNGFIYGSDRISRDTNTIPEESETFAAYSLFSSFSLSGPCGCAVEMYGMCDCRYGMKCGVCIELSKRVPMICDCDCIIPVKISEKEEDAEAGNKTRIVNVTTGGQIDAKDLWLVVIYGTATTNFSFVVKADEKNELFYQNNVTSITVRLADGVPNNIGGGDHNGFIYGTDRVLR